jgi:hypothetical protein
MIRKVHKKLKHHLSKMSSFYTSGLGGLLAIFSIFVGVFFITQAKDPYVSELAFIETSTSKIGSVIPASCFSAPPTNHFDIHTGAPDCPPAVEVNLGTGSNNLTASITGVSPNPDVFFNAPNTWTVGNGGTYNDTPSIPISINYTSGGGSIKCRLKRDQNLSGNIRPPSGTFVVDIYPLLEDEIPYTKTFSLVCSDGVYFKTTNSINVITNYKNYTSQPE